MKKFNTLLHNPDVQGILVITFMVCAIAIAFVLSMGK